MYAYGPGLLDTDFADSDDDFYSGNFEDYLKFS